MSEKKDIFCILVKDLLHSEQTFCFKEMFLALKICLIIIENCIDLFSASLNIQFPYNKEQESSTLPTSSKYTSFSTSELDNYTCKEFVSIAIKNKVINADRGYIV